MTESCTQKAQEQKKEPQEKQWQADAYQLSSQHSASSSWVNSGCRQNPPEAFKASCLMGLADCLELGFYSHRPPTRLNSPPAEGITPRRGRINRVLSRLTFQSTDPLLGNFGAVDAVVLRGAMPEGPADFMHLKQKYNVGTIIDLRGWETSEPAFIDYERFHSHQNGMRYLHLPMDSRIPPNLGQLQLFFRVIEESRQHEETVYVHCKQGVDRTGAMVAAYAVASGLSQRLAFKEMCRHGYNWRHRLTRPAQREFVLSPALSNLLQSAQHGAELQGKAQALKDNEKLDPQAYEQLLCELANGNLESVLQRLNLLHR